MLVIGHQSEPSWVSLIGPLSLTLSAVRAHRLTTAFLYA